MKLGSTLFSLALTFGVTAAAVACSDSAEEAKAAAAKTEAQEQDAFLDNYCQIILKCCNVILKADLNDIAGCKARIQTLDPVTAANKQARADCIPQAKLAFQKANFCPDFEHMDMPSCPRASRGKLVGTKKVGEVCATAAECAPDFGGVVDCKGVCQVRKRGGDGDGPCDATVDGDVVTKLAAEETGATVFTCYRKADGLQCDPISKTCLAPFADRAQCEDSGSCAKTQFCDSEEKRCFDKFPVNYKCFKDEECGGKCDDEKCKDAAVDGESCTANSNCKDGLECVSGACQLPGADAHLAASCK